MITVGAWLSNAVATLQAAHIPTARLDSLILLEDELKIDRAHILAHPDLALPGPTIAILNNNITQRSAHKPLAYIRGRVAFYGRIFAVNNSVLIPRPETEALIQLLKTVPQHPHMRIVDVGTGSGCLAITAALEIPGSIIYAYDISPEALALAHKNAQLHSITIHMSQSNVLAGMSEQFQQPIDALLANLPYVPNAYAINEAATFEPKIALFSGSDGLDLYRTLWQELATLPAIKPGHVIVESLAQQHAAMTTYAKAAGYQLRATEQLAQHFTL